MNSELVFEFTYFKYILFRF